MKQIFKRLKQGLPEGSSHKLRTMLKWFLFGVSESYSIRMANKYSRYKIIKMCSAKTEDLHPCDVTEWHSCRNCELG